MSRMQKFMVVVLVGVLGVSIGLNIYYYRYIKARQVRPSTVGGARATLR